MIPRIRPDTATNHAMAWIIFFYLFIHFAESGRPTEERLLMRLRDIERESDDPVLLDDASADRSRRQLPTEINIQVTAPLFTARLYDYGISDGDKEVPPSIDVGIKFELKQPLTFYDQKLTEIYILSNGGIGFEANSRNYKSDVFHGGPMLIAPLWNRNDLRKGGKIFYREVSEGRAIERAQSEVRYQYDKAIKPTSVLLVTWEHMQPMGDQNLSQENSNTFQAAIISSDNGTFANFIYKSIGWTQGAEAGFSKGDSKNFYSLPTSGTSNIMYLKEYGNTGIPGEWIFEIGQQRMIRCKPGIKGDTCDDECAEFEWGNDCEKCCHCGKGRCNAHTGECPGECKQCWKNAPHCDKRENDCKVKAKECGYNAISFTDFDKCGEAVVRCQCLSGYVGDGYNCTDVDECAKPNTCSPSANCYNTPGRYYCECQSGFKGNGTVCTPSADGGSSGGGGGISITSGNRTQPGVQPSPGAAGPSQAATFATTAAHDQTSPEEITSPTPTSPPTEASSIGTTPLAPGLGIQLITAGTGSSTSTTTTPTTAPSSTAVTSAPTPTTNSTLSSTAGLSSQTQPEATTRSGTTPPSDTARATSAKTQYPDAVQTLPKETFSQITYRLRQPLNIFGKRREHLTISSTGLVSLDDVPPVTPDDDLEQLGVSGFAPFFGKIDLGQRGVGAVTVRETSHSFVLTEATTLVDNYFHAPGFMAKSVLTISFDNVTNSARQQKNNFQIVLIGGNNALGENVTYVEYVYSNLQWSEGAQAVILADNSANSVLLPGSGSDGVRQLSQLSNIDEPGQWMYRVDLERVTCPQSNLLPPYCNSDTPAPTVAPTTRAVSHSPSVGNHRNTSDGAAVVNQTGAGIEHNFGTIRPGTTPFISFTDEEDETITFPAFVTVLPQLITQNTPNPQQGTAPRVEAGTALPVPPPTLSVTLRTDSPLGTRPPAVVPQLPATLGPPQPPANTGWQQTSTNDSRIFVPTVEFGVVTSQSIPTINGSGEETSSNLPPLLLFTTPKRQTRPPVPTRPPPRIVTATQIPGASPPGPGRRPPPLIDNTITNNNNNNNYIAGENEELDSLNSPSKLAIIIPTAIVGVWLLLLMLIGIVVCCKRRSSRRRMRNKYDPGYHFRHMPSIAAGGRSKDAAAVAAAAAAAASTSAPTNAVYPQPHVTYEDHLEKAARLSEMSQYGQNGGRVSMYGSYWNMPSSNRQYSYYNQGYYESCPEFNRTSYYNGRY